MKYFLIDINRSLLTSPRIVRSFDVINRRNVNMKNHKAIDKRNLMYIESNVNTIFTGVIMRPFFMLSEKLFEIAEKYESDLVTKQVVLLDVDNKVSVLYHMPILQRINCASNREQYKNNKNINPILKKNRLPEKSLFMLEDLDLPVVRLDLAESFLRREERGISLIPIEVK